MPVLPAFLGRLLRNGVPIGSGFVVADSGLVATCAHVVVDEQSGGIVIGQKFEFQLLVSIQSATTDVANAHTLSYETTELNDLRFDVALLRLTDQVSNAMPSVATLAESRSVRFLSVPSWHTAGYSSLRDSSAEYSFTSTDGVVVGPAVRNGVDVLQLRANDVQRGMSGAPVILDNGGMVIGIISERYHSEDDYNSNTVWAIRAEHFVRVGAGLVRIESSDRRLIKTLASLDRLSAIAPKMSSEARVSLEIEIGRQYVFDELPEDSVKAGNL
jgi:Trypsin-like peptidase domain